MGSCTKNMDIHRNWMLLDTEGQKMHPVSIDLGMATISCSLGQREYDPRLWHWKWCFWGVSRHATSTMTKMDAFHNTTINHPASSCHWIMYEGVFPLDTTIFMVSIAISTVFGICVLGEIFETQNDNFSWTRAFYEAFEDVSRPQQWCTMGCKCQIWARCSISVANALFICSMDYLCILQQIIISRQRKLQWRSQNIPRAWQDIVENKSRL